MMTRLIILAVVLATFGCEGSVALSGDHQTRGAGAGATTPKGEPSILVPEETEPEAVEATPTPTEPEVVVEIPEFTPAQIDTFVRAISQMLVSRPPSEAEVAAIASGGTDALAPMLRSWAAEPAFADNARYMMQQKLRASGSRDDIDFELPGNLVSHVVQNDLPWETILTADYCVDVAGTQIPCDTGAPFAAGVLGTRAYLAGNASRFNLGRANRLMNVFACRAYPMESELQPYLEKSKLIPMFQANSVEEQTVEEAAGGFGNGSGCYTCHGQFGAHAQLFVKFDQTGLYRPEATGLQDTEGELGRSVDGLMASHFNEPTRAADERSQVFGAQVANLAEAARTIAEAEPFLPCQAKSILQHTFGLSDSAPIDPKTLTAITERALGFNADPTYTDLVVATFTEPGVILSIVGNQGGTQ